MRVFWRVLGSLSFCLNQRVVNVIQSVGEMIRIERLPRLAQV